MLLCRACLVWGLPEELVRKIVFASSQVGDIVLDPCSGSGTTAVVAVQLGRRFLACELDSHYNGWVAERLRMILHKTEKEWFRYDKAAVQRRESI